MMSLAYSIIVAQRQNKEETLPVAYEPFYAFYEQHGFVFDRSLLTSYCISLFTKPFVILSGISGTGKTKIAQLFNVTAKAAVEQHTQPTTPSSPPIPGPWIVMTVTDGLLNGERANLKYSDLAALLPASEIAALQPRIEELRKLGGDDNICDPFEITIDALDGETLTAHAYLQRARSPLLRLRFKSKRGAPVTYDSTGYFRKRHKAGDVLQFERIGERHLKLVSVNKEPVIEMVTQLDAEEERAVANTLFLSVRSDWTDSSYLFGYFNLIDQRYHITPLLAFLLQAAEHPNVPFFLILDEMNLAKVEHYFSDFLSCLESRYMNDGVLEQEPIRLQAGLGWLDTDDAYFDTIAPQITLPSNLFVTGTVNVDESTYMFSAKVLDRANVIELNDVNLEGYESGAATVQGSPLLLETFPPFVTTFNIPARADYIALPDTAKAFMKSVHAILSKYQLQFGYRVINEVARFVLNVETYCESSDTRLFAALDCQLLQKILPKLSGSQGKLDLPLRELLTLLTDAKETVSFDTLATIDPASTRYPRSCAKLKRMYYALMLNGFATFVE